MDFAGVELKASTPREGQIEARPASRLPKFKRSHLVVIVVIVSSFQNSKEIKAAKAAVLCRKPRGGDGFFPLCGAGSVLPVDWLELVAFFTK